MDGDAEVARELERLRAELMDFIVDGLADRMASGDHPRLSAALTDAIGRRVDQAVSQRMADAEWPDPERFADAVLAAAAGRAGAGPGAGAGRDEDAGAPRRPRPDEGARDRRPLPVPRSPLQLALAGLLALGIIAALTWFAMNQFGTTPTTNTAVINVGADPPIVYDAPANGSADAVETGNAAQPTSAGAARNTSAPAP